MPAKEKRGRLLHFLFAFSVEAKLKLSNYKVSVHNDNSPLIIFVRY